MYNAKFSKTFFKRIIEAQSWFFNYVLKQSIIINIHLKLSSNPIFIKPSISYQKLRNQIYLLLINQGILPFYTYHLIYCTTWTNNILLRAATCHYLWASRNSYQFSW